MKEIEVKVLDINKAEIIRKLKRFGAKKCFEGDIEAISYDSKDKKLAKENAFVRLRKMGNRSFLAYKRKISQKGAKVMREIETEVDDFISMNKILLRIGMRQFNDYKKRRISFKLGKVCFEIDDYKGVIPAYLEIEAPDLKTINKWIKKLGIDKKKVNSWNGAEVFKHYNVKSELIKI